VGGTPTLSPRVGEQGLSKVPMIRSVLISILPLLIIIFILVIIVIREGRNTVGGDTHAVAAGGRTGAKQGKTK